MPARGAGGKDRRGIAAGEDKGKDEDGHEGRRLASYRAKRDFAATPEPAPSARADAAQQPSAPGPRADAAGRRRFVIHEHHATRLHWDLRLERDGALASWALPKGLPDAPKDNRFAAHTEDHPLEYLDFEGEIPEGQYGAGRMTVWDRGTYECLKWESRKVEVALHGERVNARYALFPIDREEEAKDWMIHRMDPPADPDREPMPQRIVPMLARAGALPTDDEQWAYEIKWDGVRAIAYATPGELRLQSRSLNDITDKYPELAGVGRALGSRSAVLDGEIVALDRDGRPSFSALQQRMQLSTRAQARRQMKATPVTYMIFDLLWLDGHSLMTLPYGERRELLAALQLSGASWQTPDHVVGHGAALLQASAEQGLEGILAKRLDSSYQPGLRPRSWVKIKTVGRQELVVGGWLPGQGRRHGRIGALLLGVSEPDGGLRYVGRVGSGFSESELDRLAGLLGRCERARSPFTAGARPPRGSRFCEPRLVAEVEFSEWTQEGSLRHPVYKGLREDKSPAEVVQEIAGGALVHVDGRELKLSNLDKVLYPSRNFTKRDLIDYYVAVAPVLLAHLAGRPLTVTRWPDGVQGKSFFQKQAPAHRPEWVRTATIASSAKPIDYTLADDAPTLVWLANLAAIELHTPLARADAIARPTALVFDLDPGAPASVLECCAVALQLQGMFENLALQSFVKTSGAKGLQVYVPLNGRRDSYATTKPFARSVAELLESAMPELVVSRMTKTRRTGRVLIDWSQNDVKKTTVCVYSLRAGERPTASTPLEWDEVRAARDGGDAQSLVFEARTVIERVAERGDLFAPVLSLVQALPSF